jgi:hypothetical protein
MEQIPRTERENELHSSKFTTSDNFLSKLIIISRTGVSEGEVNIVLEGSTGGAFAVAVVAGVAAAFFGAPTAVVAVAVNDDAAKDVNVTLLKKIVKEIIN